MDCTHTLYSNKIKRVSQVNIDSNMNKLPSHIHPTKYPRYYIDNQGNAYREPVKGERMPINENGLVYLKPSKRGHPKYPEKQYDCVNITIRDNNGKFIKQIKKSNHQLVAETFVPNPHGYTEIDHKDRNKYNNSVENLRWVTHKENMNNGASEGKTYTIIDTLTNRQWQGINLNEWVRENCDWIYLRQRKNSVRCTKQLSKGLSDARRKNCKLWGLICTY